MAALNQHKHNGGKTIMTKMNHLTMNNSKTIENIDIDFLLHDIMIIKAESLKDKKIFKYAEYLEKQLLKIKRKEAVLHV